MTEYQAMNGQNQKQEVGDDPREYSGNNSREKTRKIFPRPTLRISWFIHQSTQIIFTFALAYRNIVSKGHKQ